MKFVYLKYFSNTFRRDLIVLKMIKIVIIKNIKNLEKIQAKNTKIF